MGLKVRLRLAGSVFVLVSLSFCARSASAADSDRLTASWQAYIQKYVQNDGRVIDYSPPPGVTTSEGQAYTLLRAVWMNDRALFERVLSWTGVNLRRGDSPLPAWKWGRTESGWGVVDLNTAADADVALAIALYAASRQWRVSDFEARARAVAQAIWADEVREIGGRWYLLPGAWAAKEDPVPLNPSYYVPPFLRRLGELDRAHPWAAVADSTYTLLKVALPVSELPPDWISLSRGTKRIELGAMKGALSGRFGYDAYRVFLNLAIDHVWDGTRAASEYLRRQTWLVQYLNLNGTLPREVSINAVPRISGPEPLALYGALLPAFSLFDRPAADRLRQLLDGSYRDGIWGAEADYYVQNLVWFGMALTDGRFGPFASESPKAQAR